MQESALYLEADEDITSAIDKLVRSTTKSVQIVVPKRSTMLQSIINLKLLKKAAENGGKELVLVTNDRIATELAGRVGLAVAPSLGAKPVLADEPEKPDDLKNAEEIIEADDPEPPPMPEPAPKAKSKKPLLSRRTLGDTPASPPPEPEPVAAADAGADKAAKKRVKVPNFNKLQRRAMWLGFGTLLIVGYFAFMYFFTSAKVTLFVNGTKVDIDSTFSADPALKTTDTSGGVLAAQLITVNKDLSGPFTPTGQKDEGTKASGTITISNCYDASSHIFVAGTRFVAPDGNLFRSTEDVTVPGGSGSFFGCTAPGTVSVSVQADQNGDKYNEAATAYTMPGLPSSEQSGKNSISAKGGQMSGGTSKTVTVVQQSDVDTAKTALLAKDKDNSQRDLQGKVPSGYTPLTASQTATAASVSPGPAVGAEGTSGTLNMKVTYTVLAVKRTEYEALVRAGEQKQIGEQNEIYDDGLSNAQVTDNSTAGSGRQSFHLTTEAYGGKKLDHPAIIKALGGKRYSDASDYASGLPGVSKADITLWPAWASNLPSRTGNITVSVKVADKQR